MEVRRGGSRRRSHGEPGEWAVRRRDRDGSEPELGSLARRFFADADVVLVEGGKATPLRKIEVMRAGVSGDLLTPAENLLAIVSDAASPAPASVPIFRPLQTAEICDLILSHEEDVMSEIMLEVDGQEVNLNPFVRTVFENTIRGMVASLSGLSPDPEAITVVIRRAKAEPGKKIGP